VASRPELLSVVRARLALAMVRREVNMSANGAASRRSPRTSGVGEWACAAGHEAFISLLENGEKWSQSVGQRIRCGRVADERA